MQIGRLVHVFWLDSLLFQRSIFLCFALFCFFDALPPEQTFSPVFYYYYFFFLLLWEMLFTFVYIFFLRVDA